MGEGVEYVAGNGLPGCSRQRLLGAGLQTPGYGGRYVVHSVWFVTTVRVHVG